MDLDAVRRSAVAAAYQGGAVLRGLWGRVVQVRHKGLADLVTEADTGSERAVLAVIRAAFPSHAVLAEESGALAGDPDCTWIIDPLDGTTNFTHGLPYFGVSIAFAWQQEVVLGIVLDPLGGDLYLAQRGRGATCNGRRLGVSTTRQVAQSLLVTGFAYDFRSNAVPVWARFNRCLMAAQGVRRLGAASLDLCRVACGQFDGYWEENLKPWDTAAGMLIAREAGAVVSDFAGRPFTVEQREILATNGAIHSAMLDLLALEA
jgi:myo-inositol-1(or 4)-monophosphatase